MINIEKERSIITSINSLIKELANEIVNLDKHVNTLPTIFEGELAEQCINDLSAHANYIKIKIDLLPSELNKISAQIDKIYQEENVFTNKKPEGIKIPGLDEEIQKSDSPDDTDSEPLQTLPNFIKQDELKKTNTSEVLFPRGL